LVFVVSERLGVGVSAMAHCMSTGVDICGLGFYIVNKR
jgi:hypothetical protein